jgi:hypothetical protein
MPVAYVDIPAGMNDGAKKKIFRELYEEIHQAWPIPDTRVLIREWPNEAVSQDGRIEDVPMRPICTLAVPPDLEHDAKKRLVRQISNTVGEACGREVEEIHLPRGLLHILVSGISGVAAGRIGLWHTSSGRLTVMLRCFCPITCSTGCLRATLSGSSSTRWSGW